jgi:hypothetical protein
MSRLWRKRWKIVLVSMKIFYLLAAGIESPAIVNDGAFAGEQEQEEDGVGVVGNVDTHVGNQNQNKEDGSVVVDNALSTTTDNNDDDDDDGGVGNWDHADFIDDSVQDDDEANGDGHACNVSLSGCSVSQKQTPARLKECYF